MKPPIIVAEGLDVVIFDTVRDAEMKIEAEDVDVFEAWDSEGLKLRVVANPPSVRILPASGDPRPEELVSLLQSYLKALGRTASAQPGNLPVLLGQCLALRTR